MNEYHTTIWMHLMNTKKGYGEKLDCICTKMLPAILNKSWKQYLTKQQLYGHIAAISKIIQIRLTRHGGHSWRSKDELISDVIWWTPSHRRAAWTYRHQVYMDTGCRLQDLPKAKDDGDDWQERVREIRASCTWWWWWLWWYI